MKKRLLLLLTAVVLLSGCQKGGNSSESAGSGYRDDVSAQSLVEAVAEELGDEYWADMELAPEYLEDWYDISSDMYEEFYGQTPMISANVDTLIIVKASEGQNEKVEEALNAYRTSMIEDTMQYPSNIPKIQASQIAVYGNYVCFVQLGGFMGGIEDDDEAAVKACQEMNGQALAVIEEGLKK